MLRSWLAVASVFVLCGVLGGVWASRIPAIAQTHQLDVADVGLLLLLLGTGAVFAFSLAGRAADRYGACSVTRRISFSCAISLVLIAFAPNIVLLSVALFTFGATMGALDVAMNTWASEVEKKAERSLMSSFHAMFSLGAGVGALSGYLAGLINAGVTEHFIVVSFAMLITTVLVSRTDWKSGRHQSAGKSIFAVPKGRLFLVGVVAFCGSVGEGAIVDWSALFLVLITNASESEAALGFAVFSVAMFVMRLFGDPVIKLLGPVLSARLAGLIALVGVLIAVLFTSYSLSLFAFALTGIGYSIIIPLAFSRAAKDPQSSPGQAIASVSTLAYGGLLLGPPVIGFLAEATSLQQAFVLLALLALLVCVFAGSLKPQDETLTAEVQPK